MNTWRCECGREEVLDNTIVAVLCDRCLSPMKVFIYRVKAKEYKKEVIENEND